MQIFNSYIFNSKIQRLSQLPTLQGADDPLTFASKLSSLNSQKLKNLFSENSDTKSVLNQILNYLGVDSENQTLVNALTHEFQSIIEGVQKELESDNSQELQEQKNVKAPIDKSELNWYLDDANNLFEENISQTDFLEKFGELSKNTDESSYYSQYINAINDMGAENFFSAIDSDGDGTLSNQELDNLINSDNDNLSISADEFNNIYGKYLDKNPNLEKTLTDKAQPLQNSGNQDKTVSGNNAVNDSSSVSSGSKSSGTNSSSGSTSGSRSSTSSGSNGAVQNTDTQNGANEQPKETVEDLMKQKDEIKSNAESETAKLNGEIDTLLASSSANQEQKDNYEKAKTEYNENQKLITDNEAKIQTFDLNIHDIDKSISALNGEKSTIKTDSGFADTDTKNKYRLTSIEAKIKELNESKTKIEEDKQALVEQNNALKENDKTLSDNLENAQKALMEGLPEETKNQINSLKEQIKTIETNKNTKISEIDAKIATLKTQEIEESKKSGEATGELESNPVGSKFVEDALKYNGMQGGGKFSTGDYGWCADFVTYVVKEVAYSMGMTDEQVNNLRHSHLGASPQKLVKKNKGHVTEVEGSTIEQLKKAIKPGMAFICKGGGESGQHTGFVAKVNDDGTFLSIEGNHGNKVCQVTRNIADMYRFVDFSYLFT